MPEKSKIARKIVSDTECEQVQWENGVEYVYHKYYYKFYTDEKAYALMPVYSRPVEKKHYSET